jgi:hypothetical protein
MDDEEYKDMAVLIIAFQFYGGVVSRTRAMALGSPVSSAD